MCALAVTLGTALQAIAYPVAGTGSARARAEVLVAFRPLFTSTTDGTCGSTFGTTVYLSTPPQGVTYTVYRKTTLGGNAYVGKSGQRPTEISLPALVAVQQQMFTEAKSGSWTARSPLIGCTPFH